MAAEEAERGVRRLDWTFEFRVFAGDESQMQVAAKRMRQVADCLEQMAPRLPADFFEKLPTGGAHGAPFGTPENDSAAAVLRAVGDGWRCVWRAELPKEHGE